MNAVIVCSILVRFTWAAEEMVCFDTKYFK